MRDFSSFFFSKGAFCALRWEKKESKERMGKGKRKEEKSGRGKKKKKEEEKKREEEALERRTREETRRTSATSAETERNKRARFPSSARTRPLPLSASAFRSRDGFSFRRFLSFS